MVKITYSIDTEAQRLFADPILSSLNGFYLQSGFYILPYQTRFFGDYRSVLMPRLKYDFFINNYFDRGVFEIKKYQSRGQTIQKYLQQELIKKDAFIPIEQNELDLYHQMSISTLSPIVTQIKNLFADLSTLTFDIQILPSRYGAYGSFYLPVVNEGGVLSVELRPRYDIKNQSLLIELFISSIIKFLLQKDNAFKWRDREAISDFFTKFVFGEVDYVGTLSTISGLDTDKLNQSLSFLSQVGLPSADLLGIDDGQNIFLAGKDITNSFAHYEKALIVTLLKNKHKLISYDFIASALYGDTAEQDFSIWGIAKTLQRTRDKLAQFGIPRNFIRNVKGRGLILS